MTVYLTGYSYWDNTPPGSAAIAKPVIHRQAGGVGTYNDPITLAVGHSYAGGRHSMVFPAGTRFYLPKIKRYAIVEDLCGDGSAPQNGPCYTGKNGRPWLDIYVGGKSVSPAFADRCMYALTGMQQAIMNPQPGYEVISGALADTGCRF
ncbi:MAG TPA: hypothetical protein ENH63_17730 [Sulfitobacter litoralis]|uniref:Uncharacterized protein n=3 Tax=root TaxID=1 RepID=A0A7V1BHY4_9RHOB|nr:hypothetical protein [Sulfitobacter litoralis]